MTKERGSGKRNQILPRIRILYGAEVAFGPGKVELLAAIEKHGSIRSAAAEMGMSYMRAWNLIQTMNKSFKKPVVVLTRGGRDKGGAQLTPVGKSAIRLYESMKQKCLEVIDRDWAEFKTLLRK